MLPPGTVDRYELGERIGKGGMSEVFRARLVLREGTEMAAAVHRIRADLAGDGNFQEMFLRKARIAAALDHPNIVRVLDLGRMDESWFVAMELVDGTDLAAVLKRSQEPLSLAATLWVGLEVLGGLHHAHTAPQPAIHHNVSPGNVLLSRRGEVKLTGFGNTLHQISAADAPDDPRADIVGTARLLTRLAGAKSLPAGLASVLWRANSEVESDRISTALDFRAALEALAEEEGVRLDAKPAAALVKRLFPPAGELPSIVQRLMPLIQAGLGPDQESVYTSSLNAIPVGSVSAVDAPPPPKKRAAPSKTELTTAVGAPDTSKAIARLAGHQGPIRSLVPTADGAWLVSGSDDRTVRVWSVSDRRESARLTGHSAEVTAVAALPGRAAASASADGTLLVWNLLSRARDKTLSAHRGPVAALALSAGGKLLVSAGERETIVWNARSWDKISVLEPAHAVAVLPDDTGRFVAAQGERLVLRSWTSKAPEEELGRGAVRALAVSADGATAVVGSGGLIRIFDLQARRERGVLAGPAPVTSLSVAGALAVAGYATGEVIVWHVPTRRSILRLPAHDGEVSAVAFSRDLTMLYSAGADRTIAFWRFTAR